MKKHRFFSVIVFGVLFNACAQGQEAVSNLTVAEFVSKLKSTKNAQLLDVRTPEEWARGKFASSTCINYMADDFKQKIEKLDKNKAVFVYCAAGGRSAKATKILQEAGFKQVYNLQGGGYADLSNAGLK